MLITSKNVEKRLLEDDVLQLSYVYSYKSRKFFKLCKDVTVQLSNGEVHTIPKGMYTDLSSVPKILWSIERPYGDFLFASVIHDYIYVKKPKGWTQKMADKEMLYWSKILNKSTILRRFDNYLRFYMVRMFGFLVWKNIVSI